MDTEELFKQMDRNLLLERKYRAIVGMTLNSLIYEARQYAIDKGMNKLFVFRGSGKGKGLLRKHFRYTKTKLNIPISRMSVYYGSTPSTRFTGWTEQQSGAKTQRERVATLQARGKQNKRVIPGKYRHNKLSGMPRRENVPIRGRKSTAHHTAAMLAILARRGYTGPVYIGEDTEGTAAFLPGIYQMLASGKVRPVQFDEVLQPKRLNWAYKLQRAYMRQTDLYKHIAYVISKVLRNK